MLKKLRKDKNAAREAEHTASSLYAENPSAEPDHLPGRELPDSEIDHLVWKMRRSSPVYRLAHQVLEAKPLSAEEIASLLSIVSAPSDIRWKERTVAVWILGRVELDRGQETENARIVRVLYNVLENKKHRSVRYIKRIFQYPLRAFPLTLPVAVLGTLGEIQRGGKGFPWWVTLAFGVCWGIGSTFAATVLFAPLLFPLSLAWDTDHADRVRAECARVLGHLQQAEIISVLVIAVRDPSRQVKRAALEALCCVLPALEVSQYESLNANATPCLCSLLNHSNPQFVVHVLEALDKVGNGSAVSYVQRLAKRSESPRVQEAAQRILPNLQRRQQQEQAPVTLLRPASGATETQPAVLLRPANKN